MTRIPDFFIIGAAKSGTTSLWNYLDQHPGIYMSRPKEPGFMALGEQEWPYAHPGAIYLKHVNATVTLDAYQSLFAGAQPAQQIGEASVNSLDVARSAGRMCHYAPRAKIIAILRQPADRAFSHYNMMLRYAEERVNDFREALALEPERIAKGWWVGYRYRTNGMYSQSLSRYLDVFDKGQIKVFLYEDLLAGPEQVMREIYGFLDVDDAFKPDVSKRLNEGGMRPAHSSLFAFLRTNKVTLALRRHAQLLYQPLKNAAKRTLVKSAVLSPALRDELTHGFREDILKLEDMIGRDLSHWLAPVAAPEAKAQG